MRQRLVEWFSKRFPRAPTRPDVKVAPPPETVKDADGKTELLFNLALHDLAETRTILAGLRTQASVGLSALIGGTAFLGKAVIDANAHDNSVALSVVAGASAVVGLCFLLWVVGPVYGLPLGLPLGEAAGWLASERANEVEYPLAGYRTALTAAVINSQRSRRAAEVRRANLLRVGLICVATTIGCLLVVLFRGP